MSKPVALVTGSATGVGRATTLRFAREGYDVVINYSRSQADAEATARDCEEAGAKPLLVQCDVSADAGVKRMLSNVKDTFGRLDVVVNNAATTHFIPHDDFETLDETKWDRMLAVNLKGPYFVSRAAVPLLGADAPGKERGGAIVNVSSVAGITGNGSSIAYCATKAGLNVMTKSLARALGPKIRVNAVLPGPIESRWIPQGDPNISIPNMVKDYPLPKPSQPEDIADAIWFFAAGTSMATGQLLAVDGGQTLG